MEKQHIDRAAELFVQARRTGVRLRELPPESRPGNVDDVNAIIEQVTRTLNEPIGGWKITFLYKPRQKPIIAPLFAVNIFDSPASVPPAITHSLLIEPEIAFRVQHDLPPRPAPYRAEEVAEALIACPALELNDTRFDTRLRPIRQMLDDRLTVLEAHADHQTSGAYVVGNGRPDWESFDYSAMRVSMRSGGRTLVETVGGHAFSDPFLPAVVLANQLRRTEGLRQGQIVATGSFSGFFPVEADQPVVVEFAGFGSAEATFCRK